MDFDEVETVHKRTLLHFGDVAHFREGDRGAVVVVDGIGGVFPPGVLDGLVAAFQRNALVVRPLEHHRHAPLTEEVEPQLARLAEKHIAQNRAA